MPKTHKGVHTEFARSVKDRTAKRGPLHAFLTRTYKLKQGADYGPAESEDFSQEEAAEVIPMAMDFVAAVEHILSGQSQFRGKA